MKKRVIFILVGVIGAAYILMLLLGVKVLIGTTIVEAGDVYYGNGEILLDPVVTAIVCRYFNGWQILHVSDSYSDYIMLKTKYNLESCPVLRWDYLVYN